MRRRGAGGAPLGLASPQGGELHLPTTKRPLDIIIIISFFSMSSPISSSSEYSLVESANEERLSGESPRLFSSPVVVVAVVVAAAAPCGSKRPPAGSSRSRRWDLGPGGWRSPMRMSWDGAGAVELS